MIPGLHPHESDRLRTLHSVRSGLVFNRAASPEVLTVLVADPGLAWAFLIRADLFEEPMPDRWAGALAVHPDPEIRAAVARSPFVPLDVRVSLATDSHPGVRRATAGQARSVRVGRYREFLGSPMPDGMYEALATDPDPETRAALCLNPDVPRQVRAVLARDSDPEVRKHSAYRPLAPQALAWLLADPDPEVRRWTLWNCNRHPSVVLPAEVLRRYLPVVGGRWAELAALVDLTPDLLAELMANPLLHKELARNPSLPVEAMETLAGSPREEVLRELVLRPGLPAHLYTRIDHDPPGRTLADWLLPSRAALDVRLSYIDNPRRILRRTVATGMDLPADAVRRLANDEDFVVRLLLCECHPDAPGETLAEVAAGWEYPSRLHLLRHKNFPPQALLPYARSEAAYVRRMVADLPGLTAELARTMLDDDQTRGVAAANPTLPQGQLRAVLNDPDPHVRFGAARNPALPPEKLRRLADGSGPQT